MDSSSKNEHLHLQYEGKQIAPVSTSELCDRIRESGRVYSSIQVGSCENSNSVTLFLSCKVFFFSDREESDQSLKNLYQKEALTYFSDTPNSLCFSLCYSTLPECSFSRRYELLVC